VSPPDVYVQIAPCLL